MQVRHTPDKFAERHLLATIRSQPEHRERVKALLLELVGPVRSGPGCPYDNLCQQAEDPEAFRLVAGGANDEVVAAHPAHPNVPRVVELVLPLLASPNPNPIGHVQTRRVSEGRTWLAGAMPLSGAW